MSQSQRNLRARPRASSTTDDKNDKQEPKDEEESKIPRKTRSVANNEMEVAVSSIPRLTRSSVKDIASTSSSSSCSTSSTTKIPRPTGKASSKSSTLIVAKSDGAKPSSSIGIVKDAVDNADDILNLPEPVIDLTNEDDSLFVEVTNPPKISPVKEKEIADSDPTPRRVTRASSALREESVEPAKTPRRTTRSISILSESDVSESNGIGVRRSSRIRGSSNTQSSSQPEVITLSSTESSTQLPEPKIPAIDTSKKTPTKAATNRPKRTPSRKESMQVLEIIDEAGDTEKEKFPDVLDESIKKKTSAHGRMSRNFATRQESQSPARITRAMTQAGITSASPKKEEKIEQVVPLPSTSLLDDTTTVSENPSNAKLNIKSDLITPVRTRNENLSDMLLGLLNTAPPKKNFSPVKEKASASISMETNVGDSLNDISVEDMDWETSESAPFVSSIAEGVPVSPKIILASSPILPTKKITKSSVKEVEKSPVKDNKNIPEIDILSSQQTPSSARKKKRSLLEQELDKLIEGTADESGMMNSESVSSAQKRTIATPSQSTETTPRRIISSAEKIESEFVPQPETEKVENVKKSLKYESPNKKKETPIKTSIGDDSTQKIQTPAKASTPSKEFDVSLTKTPSIKQAPTRDSSKDPKMITPKNSEASMVINSDSLPRNTPSQDSSNRMLPDDVMEDKECNIKKDNIALPIEEERWSIAQDDGSIASAEEVMEIMKTPTKDLKFIEDSTCVSMIKEAVNETEATLNSSPSGITPHLSKSQRKKLRKAQRAAASLLEQNTESAAAEQYEATTPKKQKYEKDINVQQPENVEQVLPEVNTVTESEVILTKSERKRLRIEARKAALIEHQEDYNIEGNVDEHHARGEFEEELIVVNTQDESSVKKKEKKKKLKKTDKTSSGNVTSKKDITNEIEEVEQLPNVAVSTHIDISEDYTESDADSSLKQARKIRKAKKASKKAVRTEIVAPLIAEEHNVVEKKKKKNCDDEDTGDLSDIFLPIGGFEEMFHRPKDLEKKLMISLVRGYTAAARLVKRADDLPEQFIGLDDETIWQHIAHRNRQVFKEYNKKKNMLDIPLLVDEESIDVDNLSEEELSEMDDENIDEELIDEEMNDEASDEEEDCDLFNLKGEDLEDLDAQLAAEGSDEDRENEGENDEDDDNEPAKAPRKKFPKSKVDDRFFSLAEMESFCDQAEKTDVDGGILSTVDDSFSGRTAYRYEDFFGKMDEVLNMDKKKKRKADTADDENRALKKKKSVRFNLDEEEEEEFNEEEKEESPTQVLFGQPEEEAKETNLKKDMKKLKATIKKLEAENMAPRSWELSGEIAGQDRDENALLETHVDFDHGSKPAPEITEDFTQKMEAIIIQRIKDKIIFDDPIRKTRIEERVESYRNEAIEDREMVKKSLTEVYEKEYQKAAGELETPEKPNEQNLEIENRMKKLFRNIDALSNFDYTPPEVKPEIRIISNMKALHVEEVGAMASTEDQTLAPEETKKRQKGVMKAADERDQTDKLRERRKKKKKQRAMVMVMGEEAFNRGKNEKNSMKKKKNKEGEEKKENLKSSNFFGQLQDTVQKEIREKTTKKKKVKSEKVSEGGSKFKL